MKKLPFCLFLLCVNIYGSIAQNNPGDAITGKWRTVENNLEVEVYKENNSFKAKIIWFNDNDDTSRPMLSRLDDNNPDKTLRSRKWIGMDVLKDLRYNAGEKKWDHGKVYVAGNGKEWDSFAWITEDSLLKVKGYWLFKFLGETLTFKRSNPQQ